MRYSKLLLIIVGLLSLPAMAGPVQSIPYPNAIVEQSGSYVLKDRPIVYTSPQLAHEANFLKDKLAGLKLNVSVEQGKGNKGGIFLRIDPSLKTPESYRLTVARGGVGIEGADRAGVFYGIQTLLQQIRAAQNERKNEIPCIKVEDAPRYAWRGFMLDVSRHFTEKEKVMELIDLMAYYKLNKFHWHLTDEPGWRIEIKKYPKLATIGGQGQNSNRNDTTARYYTQDDIREVVKYAADRHIEIIPEIDMPGHATAANKAYPQFSGGSVPRHPDFTFNPGKEETFVFLTDILKEVAALFPSKYIHIGGDEVSFGIKAWETNPDVLALMKRENLMTTHDVEIYFNKRMAKVVNGLGKTVMGWDELLSSGLDNDKTLIQWWRHDRVNALKQSLDRGYPTLMSPRRPMYFDFIQMKGHKIGRVWGGFNPIEDVYSFPDKGFASWKLSPSQSKHIVGIQANLWTENYISQDQRDFMIYPRLCALAESAWSSSDVKDFEDFSERLNHAYRLFDTMKIYYFDTRNPERHPEPGKGQAGAPQDYRD